MRMMIAALLVLGLAGTAVAAQESSRAPVTKAAASSPVQAPVNLNTATMVDLETLPGVGTATAQRILEYRQQNGAPAWNLSTRPRVLATCATRRPTSRARRLLGYEPTVSFDEGLKRTVEWYRASQTAFA